MRIGIPDEGVDLDSIDIVKLLQCLLDLSLVCLDINDEHQSVVLLNLLHGALRVERVDDDFVLIEARLMRNGLSWVFGRTGELEGLGLVEGCRKTDLANLVRVRLAVLARRRSRSEFENILPSRQTSQQRWLACCPCPWWQHL
jgi:hypothetical protein